MLSFVSVKSKTCLWPTPSVDVIISNCVINLSPDKRRVFREAFRVLRPGGRLAISDVIATAPLPEAVRNDLALYSSCIGGAVTMAELETMLSESGFHDIRIQPKDESREFIREWAPGRISKTTSFLPSSKPSNRPLRVSRHLFGRFPATR